MADIKSLSEFPIDKIYLVSGGVEKALDVTHSSADRAPDKDLQRIFLVSGSNEIALDVNMVSPEKPTRK